jgi:hypothetical protein
MRRGLILALIAALVGLAAGAAWIAVRDWRRGYKSTRGATIVRFTLHSGLVHRDLHEILVLPAGSDRGRELLVFLHGRSSPPDSNLRQPLFDALHDLGRRAPAVLLADGGDHSYWHDRKDGEWGTSMLREAIPAGLARSHADRRRVATMRRLYSVPIWIDVGRDDSFMQADTTLARELRNRGTRVRLAVHSGGHGGWSGRMAEYLRFYARACA